MENNIETIVKELGRLISKKNTVNFVEIKVSTKDGMEYKYDSLADKSKE